MFRKHFYLILAGTFCLTSMAGSDSACAAGCCQGKDIIGETARIRVKEADFDYIARIDTGARMTSIHAVDLLIEDASDKPQENIGKTVTFVTRNNQGLRKILSGKIVDVATVKNAQGREQRYEVELTLQWHGKTKQVRVNLRDRSKMTYKLLIGRNWLAGDYLVDVARKVDK